MARLPGKTKKPRQGSQKTTEQELFEKRSRAAKKAAKTRAANKLAEEQARLEQEHQEKLAERRARDQAKREKARQEQEQARLDHEEKLAERRARDRTKRELAKQASQRLAAIRVAAAKKSVETKRRKREQAQPGFIGPTQDPGPPRTKTEQELDALRLRRSEFSELFKEDGTWQSYPNGRGEGQFVLLVPPGVSTKKVLFDLEIRTIDVVVPFEEVWVSVGLMFKWVQARDTVGRSRDERYDRYKSRWTVWTYARKSRFLPLAITQAEAILLRALDTGHAITGVALRVFFGGDRAPRHWKRKKYKPKKRG